MDGSNKNKGTQMGLPEDPRATWPEAMGLFARAAAYLPRSPRFGSERGVRLFWLEGGELRFRDVVEDPRGFAIVGRHSQAHVCLEADETIALRHFVVRVRRAASGKSELVVSDLLAPLPLFVDGSDEPLHACVLEGAFSARLGAYALCGFPFDGCAALGDEGGPGRGDRPDDNAHAGVVNADDVEGPVVHAPLSASRASVVPDDDIPFPPIAPLARPPAGVSRGTLIEARPRSAAIESMDSAHSELAHLTLELRGPERAETLHLTRAQLAGWVIIGHYARCAAGGQVFSAAASRMHLALTLGPDGVEVFDLASTNGVFLGKRRVKYACVRGDAEFALGPASVNHVRIRLHGPNP